MVAEIFTKLMNKGKDLNMLDGFSIRNEEKITHLQYADDTIVFLNANEDEAENLVLVLHIFEAITGLAINYSKSVIIGVEAEGQIQSMADILHSKIDKLPLRYLGMPVGERSGSITIWDAVIEKFQKKLAPWKKRFFTKAGAMTLIKSTLSSLPIYYMSVFEMPSTVEKKLRKIMKDFYWGSSEEKKRMNWISWKKICKPKTQGGLGVRNLRVANKALLSKWTWRFSKEKNRQWRRIIQHKNMGEEEDMWVQDNKMSHGRGVWKGIQKQKKLIEDITCIKIGNGRSIKFWWDKWKDGKAMKNVFPNIYKLANNKKATVAEMIVGRQWNMMLRRNLKLSEIEEVTDLFSFLEDPPDITSSEDELQCKLAQGYSVRDCYNWQIQQNQPQTVIPYNCIWIKGVPAKVQIFIWAAAQNAIPTRDNLTRRGCSIPDTSCAMCNVQQESVNHILLHCATAQRVWNYFLESYNLR